MNPIKLIGWSSVITVILLLGILTTIPTILAVEETMITSYETAGVGRIVGDNPAEMKKQLEKTNLVLTHGAYYADDALFDSTEDKVRILRSYFPERAYEENRWTWEDVDDLVAEGRDGQFLAIEGRGRIDNNRLILEDDSRTSINVRNLEDWKRSFQDKETLLLVDAQHAGIYLPKSFDTDRSLVGQLGEDASIIAPTSVVSREFVKAFMCNLNKQNRQINVGEAFRLARNNYYWGVSDIDNFFAKDEYVGLTMLSYLLWGNPLAKIETPRFDDETIEDECPEYTNPLFENEALSVKILGVEEDPLEPTDYIGEYTYHFVNPQITEEEEFEILKITNDPQFYEEDKPALQKQLQVHDYPFQTLVKNVELVAFEDPEEFTLENLPGTNNGSFVERTCEQEREEPVITYSSSSSEDKKHVLVSINPTEIVNCEEGRVKLYKTVKYRINYLPYSPVVLKGASAERILAENQETTADITVENIASHATIGTLVIKDEEGSIRGQQNIRLQSAQVDTFTVPYHAPQKRGEQRLMVAYQQQGDTKTKSSFLIYVNPLVFFISQYPEKVQQGEPLQLSYFVQNNLGGAKEFDLVFTLEQKSGGEEIVVATQQAESFSIQEHQGQYSGDIAIDTDNLEPGFYTLRGRLITEGQMAQDERLVLIADLSRPFAPQLEPLPAVTAIEGEIIRIQPQASDQNGDLLAFTLPQQFRENGVWQTGKHDAGNYNLEVKASDGVLEDSKQLAVRIQEKNSENTFRRTQNGLSVQTAELVYDGNEEKTIYLRILKKAHASNAQLQVESLEP